MKNPVKPADVIIIGVTLLVIAVISLQIYGNRSEASQVRIDAAGVQWIYPLEQDVRLIIPGPIGETEVIIEKGEVHVHDSSCRNKICVTTGEIHRVGQWIICLPNDVFIRIEGAEPADEEVDDVAF